MDLLFSQPLMISNSFAIFCLIISGALFADGNLFDKQVVAALQT